MSTRPRRFVIPACAAIGVLALSTAFALGARAESAPTDETASASESGVLSAEEKAEYERLVALDSSLTYQSGVVELRHGLAELSLPDSLRYLDPEQTERLLVEGWGNLDGSNTLGMIVPGDMSPLSGNGWGVVVRYEEEGYIPDDDAESIDYAAVLEEMKQSAAAENEARAAQGVARVELVGWAEPPRYDAHAKKLFWAKELAFEGSASNTLNYNVRVLGRRGVLTLNAVAGMSQLETVQAVMPAIITSAEFREGHRYADYEPGSDSVAAYGLATLVAGKVAAKSGLFAKLAAGPLTARIILIPVAIALAGGLSAWWHSRRATPRNAG